MDYIAIILAWLFVWIVPAAGLFYAVYFLTTLPLRRQERARLFIDLLASEVNKGGNVEQAVVAISHSKDQALGARFHLVAAHVENGLRLTDALDRVPRFLPPQISEMLKTGQAIGDLKRVLPVSRSLLNEGQSRTQSAFNYLFILAFVLTPVVPYLFLVLNRVILPKYLETLHSYLGSDMPELTSFAHSFGLWLAVAELLLAALIYAGAFVYIGGPRVWGWLRRIFGALVDETVLRIPWQRKKIERNFSAMLALLLDANVPEPKAIQFAAESTANDAIVRRGKLAGARLSGGARLIDALDAFDESGELRWRLANASHSVSGFQLALRGWHDALEAKAYQQEQAASQFVTTGLVILNGLLVGVLIIGIFQALVALLNTAVLW